MAGKYSIHGVDANTDATTIIALKSSTSVWGRIYDLILGSKDTPTDEACTYQLKRFSADGVATAVTPQPLDPDDVAASCTAGKVYTSEPTYTANTILLYVSLNKRATFRWLARPGAELYLSTTSGEGIGLLCDTPTTAFNEDVCIHFAE